MNINVLIDGLKYVMLDDIRYFERFFYNLIYEKVKNIVLYM